MKNIIVGLRDRVAGQFQNVTIDINADVAKRNLSFAVNNSPDLLFKAKDLELFELGFIDSESGNIELTIPTKHLCFCSDLIGDKE